MKDFALATLIFVIVQYGSGCSFLPEQLSETGTVKVSLPVPHPIYALRNEEFTGSVGADNELRPGYTVRWYAADGSRCERSGISAAFTLELDKSCFTPILLYCESETIGIPSDCLPVAGALYPVHAEAGDSGVSLTTSWNGGIDAELAERIFADAAGGFAAGRTIAAHFNWRRFDRELLEIDDPSNLDRGRFLGALLSGNFSVYDITDADSVAAAITLPTGTIPAGTPFIPACPGGNGFIWQSDGQTIVALPEGRTVFFCETGYLTIQLEAGKFRTAFFTRYTLQD